MILYLTSRFLAGEDYEEVSKAPEDAENCSKNLTEATSIQSDNEVPRTKTCGQIISNVSKNNCDPSPETPVTTDHDNSQIIPGPDGNSTEVRMRGPVRRYSQKTASFRWSGTEMLQIDGPPSLLSSPKIEDTAGELDIKTELITQTKINIGYKKTNSKLERKLSSCGFSRSPTFPELAKDGDNCFKALLDQMSQPNQDFKVWEKDDFSFLRWYVAKQLEIQLAAGKAAHYVHQNHTENIDDFLNHVQKDEFYVDSDYLHSVSKIFNKDIIILDSSDSNFVTHIKGGSGGAEGKGDPLYLAHLRKEEAGENYYQSILPDENCDLKKLLLPI